MAENNTEAAKITFPFAASPRMVHLNLKSHDSKPARTRVSAKYCIHLPVINGNCRGRNGTVAKQKQE